MIRTRPVLAALGLAVLAACNGAGPDRGPAAPAMPPLDVTQSRQEARQLFGAESVSYPGPPAAFGGYARGCVGGAEQLPETGPTWQAMRLNRNRNWALPVTLDYVQDLSREVARTTSWNGIYVGDMSQPRGGPMLTGHRSHQSGLDIDIWMRPATNLNLTRAERETLSSISMRRANGAYVNDSWTEDHWRVLRAAASDPRVARIFVFPGAKVWMCDNETGDRSYLRNIRPWWGHHYHFHVRLSCPPGMPACEDQAAPPPGDGCDQAREWVQNILNPPPPDPNAPPLQPRRELTLGDLPRQCAAILSP
ncbi:penicillin-insensitive murein endopeptidase [Rhodophyticola porphyridii]|uniref:Penicillin-insensitive murein endopeptidase n=1 Tax=Rhodophyticola porphyridii TaxID=1852017 RepID=A0A3L9Y3S7_9RHOB|nr:penicillin-insensitive murein endopeptidase [Rhodophyticola porphyridii]RMA43454.1 penicillin-insensitive murein endopeptidase [Rhodophyticola porphyridii]